MNYIFSVKETSYGSIFVEANNEEEAREKAWEEYHDGNTEWCWGDLDVEIEFKHKEEEKCKH